MSIKIVEEFCNDSRLFISVPKTFFTVFHHEDDRNVVYQDGDVYVDGQLVDIRIYDQRVAATPSFKYLGVHVDRHGQAQSHCAHRVAAFQRAALLLRAGMSRIPACSHSFLRFLWSTLVAPVAFYGMEVYTWTHNQAKEAQQDVAAKFGPTSHMAEALQQHVVQLEAEISFQTDKIHRRLATTNTSLAKKQPKYARNLRETSTRVRRCYNRATKANRLIEGGTSKDDQCVPESCRNKPIQFRQASSRSQCSFEQVVSLLCPRCQQWAVHEIAKSS